jgi:hypothetical protein
MLHTADFLSIFVRLLWRIACTHGAMRQSVKRNSNGTVGLSEVVLASDSKHWQHSTYIAPKSMRLLIVSIDQILQQRSFKNP